MHPEVIILRERCLQIGRQARKAELERRKKANALVNSSWFVRPEDYAAADEAAFDAIWRELTRQKHLLCGNAGES